MGDASARIVPDGYGTSVTRKTGVADRMPPPRWRPASSHQKRPEGAKILLLQCRLGGRRSVGNCFVPQTARLAHPDSAVACGPCRMFRPQPDQLIPHMIVIH